MVETTIKRRAALHETILHGDFGEIKNNQPGVTITNRAELSMVQVAAWDDQVVNTIANIEKSIGIKPDQSACSAIQSDAISALWLGPDRWLIVEKENRDLEAVIREEVTEEMAAITDQSHSRCVLRLSGPQARNVLRKGTLLDLDERYFTPGDVRITSLFHMNGIIHCIREDSFDLYVARSFGQSFFEVITHAAMEYGYRIEENL